MFCFLIQLEYPKCILVLLSGLWEVMGRKKEMSAFPVVCYLVLFMDAELTVHQKFINICIIFCLIAIMVYSLETQNCAALFHLHFSVT